MRMTEWRRGSSAKIEERDEGGDQECHLYQSSTNSVDRNGHRIHNSWRSVTVMPSVGGHSEDAGFGLGSSRLQHGWVTFLRQWNQPMMRMMIAQCIPDVVAIIWQDDFLKLATPNWEPSQKLTACRAKFSPADEEAIIATRKLLRSIMNCGRITAAAMLLALFFIRRYRTTPRSELGCAGSQYRMFLVGMLLAHKYSEDHPFSNRVWAQFSEIPVMHVNIMERDFLLRINHRLSVEFQDFQSWVVGLDCRFGWSMAIDDKLNHYRTLPLPPPPPPADSIIAVSMPASQKPLEPGSAGGRVPPAPANAASRRYSHVFSL